MRHGVEIGRSVPAEVGRVCVCAGRGVSAAADGVAARFAVEFAHGAIATTEAASGAGLGAGRKVDTGGLTCEGAATASKVRRGASTAANGATVGLTVEPRHGTLATAANLTVGTGGANDDSATSASEIRQQANGVAARFAVERGDGALTKTGNVGGAL